MTLPVPDLSQPLVNAGGRIKEGPWTQFFQQFTQAPTAAMSLIVGASPFSYVAREPGLLAPIGGVITSLTLIRGSISIDVTSSKLIPVSIKDTLKVIYTGLPIIRFLPNY